MNESLLLAQNVATTCYDDITGPVVETTKRSVLDAIGVTLAASTLGEGCQAFVDLALEQGGKSESTIVGFGARVPAAMAALANGAMAHALDFEDAHDGALVHPNAATVPAALAVAESIGMVSGKEFIAAVALGSDLVCRLGLALNQDLLPFGWYMPPVLGAFGATAAAGKLLKLNARQILDAFSLTLCQATCSAELVHSKQSVVRSVRDAFAAKAGVLSALLAQKRVAGFEEPFEGPSGFYASFARGNYDRDRLTSKLGKVFEGGNVSFKPYPSCRGTHAYIDAVLDISQCHGLNPQDVESIRIVVSPVNQMLCEPRAIKREPATAIDAKFSLPFVLASALVHGQVTLDQFTPEALKDRVVLDLAEKVAYQVNSELTRHQAAQGSLQIDTRGGSFSRPLDVALGNPAKPMSDAALVSKFRQCGAHAAAKTVTQELDKIVELVLNLEQVQDMHELTECL